MMTCRLQGKWFAFISYITSESKKFTLRLSQTRISLNRVIPIFVFYSYPSCIFFYNYPSCIFFTATHLCVRTESHHHYFGLKYYLHFKQILDNDYEDNITKDNQTCLINFKIKKMNFYKWLNTIINVSNNSNYYYYYSYYYYSLNIIIIILIIVIIM